MFKNQLELSYATTVYLVTISEGQSYNTLL